MLYFHRIDVSEDIDLNKTSASKECDIILSFTRMPEINVIIYLMMSMNL